MHTRAAARRSAAAAQWVDLPQPLWEAIAAQLPTADVMSLRQAWRGASQLASQRVRSEAVDSLKAQLNDSLVMAYCVAEQTAVHGVPLMLEALGVPDLDFLSGFLEGGANALSHNFGCRFERTQLGAFLPLPGVESYRCTFELEPRHTGVIMQAVITLTEPTFPEAGTAAVDLEELRFLTTDGSLLLEYGLSYALDSHRRTTRMLRLGSGPGFGRLQGRPLDEAAAHFAALREAAKQQPLRTASGRWSDGLLLPAIHAAVLRPYPLQFG